MGKKKILLVVTGGIASYKAVELLRLLVNKDFELNCVLTDNVSKFVTQLTFESLLGKKVYSKLFCLNENTEMSHIKLANHSDLVLVIPATANFIGKIANGIADDLSSTIILATNRKIILAPGMNVGMWENAAVKENINKLSKRGIKIIQPGHGKLACGQIGVGKLVEIDKILEEIDLFFKKKYSLNGKKVVVTSGPSIENIDPVRFISNHSSGKQGYEIAKSLSEAGASTTLITGPTNIIPHENIEVRNVRTGKEFLYQSLKSLPADIFISVAAISDWRAKKIFKQKVKKNSNVFDNLKFTKNVDVLKEVSKSNCRPKLVIGFAAETENLLENSLNKFKNKRCDWLFANLVSEKVGFGADDNKLIFFKKNYQENWPTLSKRKIAEKITQEIFQYFKKSA